MSKVKAWLPPKARGDVAASVDGVKLGYGKENAVELTDKQLERLRDGGVTDIQTESASSGSGGSGDSGTGSSSE